MTVDRTKLRVVARGNHRDGYRGVVEIGFYAALIPFECGHKHPETADARDCVRKLVWRLLDDHAGVRVTGDAGLDVERLTPEAVANYLERFPEVMEHLGQQTVHSTGLGRRIAGVRVTGDAGLDVERLTRWRDALVMANCPDPDEYPEDAERYLAALDDINTAIGDDGRYLPPDWKWPVRDG